MNSQEEQNEIILFASDLKNNSLDQIEVHWILHLANVVFTLSRMVYEDEVASTLAMESTKEVLRSVVRRGRFPTSYDILSSDSVSVLKYAVKSDFERPWEVSNGETGSRYEKKMDKLGLERGNDS